MIPFIIPPDMTAVEVLRRQEVLATQPIVREQFGRPVTSHHPAVVVSESIGRVSILHKGRSLAKHSLFSVKDANDDDALAFAMDSGIQRRLQIAHEMKEKFKRERS